MHPGSFELRRLDCRRHADEDVPMFAGLQTLSPVRRPSSRYDRVELARSHVLSMEEEPSRATENRPARSQDGCIFWTPLPSSY